MNSRLSFQNMSWSVWRPATREARDTLFMLALILWTVAPHLLRISPWISALCLAVLAWRIRLALNQAPLPGRWSLVGVLLVAAGLTWLDESTLIGKDAGVTLLVVLMALKTLELRARRDALVVFFLGFFLILTQFLYSQSLATALGMLAAVWGWLTALTLAHMPSGQPSLAEAGRRSAFAALVGTPVMVLLFVLFPRIGPLWSMPNDSSRTGLSDRVELGQVADLAQDNSIAMRLRFDGPVPPPDQRYFRGPVLSFYDGERWAAPIWQQAYLGLPHNNQPALPSTDPRYHYELTLEPLRIRWLPLLDFALMPPQGPGIQEMLMPTLPGNTLEWRLNRDLGERLRMQAWAWAQPVGTQSLSRMARDELTRLPPYLHPKTREWARQLWMKVKDQPAPDRLFVAQVLRHIRENDYSYTLRPGKYPGDSIDGFWVERRAGFCEHYASALAVILRSVGIPARMIIGYQGSDPVPVDGYFVVRQSHAHAWVEYWQEGLGWTRTDPTAAVAPERIDRSEALQAPRGLMAGTLEAVSPGLLMQLSQWYEMMDNRWNQWVMGYGRQQQFNLLDIWGLDAADWTDLLQVVAMLGVIVASLGAAWAWWDARRQSPWAALSQKVRQQLRRLDVSAAAHEAPGTWAERLSKQGGESASEAVALLRQLERARYAPEGELSSSQIREWRRQFGQAIDLAAERLSQPLPTTSGNVRG